MAGPWSAPPAIQTTPGVLPHDRDPRTVRLVLLPRVILGPLAVAVLALLRCGEAGRGEGGQLQQGRLLRYM